MYPSICPPCLATHDSVWGTMRQICSNCSQSRRSSLLRLLYCLPRLWTLWVFLIPNVPGMEPYYGISCSGNSPLSWFLFPARRSLWSLVDGLMEFSLARHGQFICSSSGLGGGRQAQSPLFGYHTRKSNFSKWRAAGGGNLLNVSRSVHLPMCTDYLNTTNPRLSYPIVGLHLFC
jgi:hypothetical protein